MGMLLVLEWPQRRSTVVAAVFVGAVAVWAAREYALSRLPLCFPGDGPRVTASKCCALYRLTAFECHVTGAARIVPSTRHKCAVAAREIPPRMSETLVSCPG